MGFGFRKSIKIAPGIRLNVSNKGIGTSIGTKGLRYSVNSRGQSRVTASIPGTGLYHTTNLSSGRNYRTNAYQRQSDLNKLLREQDKLDEMKKNKLEFDMFQNKIEMIKSIHKECDQTVDWYQVKQTPPPFSQSSIGINEQEATNAYNNYKPGFLNKLFSNTEKEKSELLNKIQEAKNKDQLDYQEWDRMVKVAEKVTQGDIEAYFQVIQEFAPLDDLVEFGSGFEFFAESPNYMEVEFDVQTNNVVTKELISLTKTGKLSVKEMPKTQYYDIQQDYVCSCVLRIARDMFALLPLDYIYIHAFDEQLNSSTGYTDKQVILSIKIERNVLNQLNMDLIDPSDSIVNFQHNMKFVKNKGFSFVNKLI